MITKQQALAYNDMVVSKAEPRVNTPEQAAVITHRGNAVVSAVPGSGKSTTLVERVRHLVGQGVAMDRILVLMFNVSAREHFRSTLNKRAPGTALGTVMTFDALAFHLCKKLAAKGHLPDWPLVDQAWRADKIAKEALAQALQELNMAAEVNRYALGDYVAPFIEFMERHKVSLNREPEESVLHLAPIPAKLFPSAFRHYEALRVQQALRFFVDLTYDLVRTLNAKRGQSELPAFDYIIIDEAQDSTALNLALLKHIAGRAEVIAVGDPDQTVYTFRGADPDIMMHAFAQHFPETQHLSLTHTFRYGPKLSALANKLIANNQNRISKTCVSAPNNPDTLVYWKEESHTATFIQEIKSWVATGGKYRDIAALFRMFTSTAPYQFALLAEQIPFVVQGGDLVYDMPEFSALIAHVDLARLQQSGIRDEKRMLQCLGALTAFPKTYLPKQALQALYEKLLQQPLGEWSKIIVNEASKQKNNGTSSRLYTMSQAIAHALTPTDSILDILNGVMQILEWNNALSTQLSRDLNLYLGTTLADNFFRAVRYRLDSLEIYMQTVDKQRETYQRLLADNKADRVILTSMHRTKGLEYDCVILPALRDGALPCCNNLDELYDTYIEDERRLLFVAMTRAVKRLVALSPPAKSGADANFWSKPSPFLREAFQE